MSDMFKSIGDYISVIDERNVDGIVSKLTGISIDKCYIPSVANVIGTDLHNYKVVKKGRFACSLMQVSRDHRIPVAMYQEDEPSIISPAYVIFEVTRKSDLLPSFLDLWFKRKDFDREATFHAIGGVRASLEWNDFCNMKLPILPIHDQRKIVLVYNTFTKRIELLNKLNQNLTPQCRVAKRQSRRTLASGGARRELLLKF